MIGQWSTPIAVLTINGPDGYPECAMPALFARCRAKDVRRTTQPVKASSGDSRRKSSIVVIGELTVNQFIEVLNSYIRWYNATRIKVSLGSLSPVEYRRSD
jgi:hypothetical protein